jgi:Bacterial Ig domain/Domain of unknown function DUF11
LVESRENKEKTQEKPETKTKKIKKTQEKTILTNELKLTVPDVSNKYGVVKIDFPSGTEVATNVKESIVESNPIQDALDLLTNKTQTNETEITVLDQSSIQANQTPKMLSEKLTFEFGNPNEHLIFSKPVKIQTAIESTQTSFDVQVTHKGDLQPSASGLSLNPETCETNNSESLTVPVVDGQITFYTCGASTFSITPSTGTSPITYPANGSTVNANTTFVGTGSVNGATIELTIPPSSTVIGTTTVKNGQWSITPASPLPVGSNTVCVGAACNTFTVTAASTFQGLSCNKVYGSTFVSPVGAGQTQIVQYNPVTDVKNTLPFTLPVTFGATRAVAVSPDGTTITYYDDTQTRFESYNTFTGATVNGPATAMAGIPNTAFNRMGYNSLGEIYSLVTIAAAPSSTYLIKVDPVSLAATNLGILTDKAGNAVSVSALGGGDLIFDNADKGYLIDNNGYFFKIDISTRVATFLATAPATTPAGLAYGPNGLIYTFTSATPNGNIYAIDLAANTISLMETQTGTIFADAFGCAFPDVAAKPSAGKTPSIVTGATNNGTGGVVSTTPATILSPGDLVEYKIVLRNGGITAATNSKYQDTLPSGTTYVAGSTKMNTTAVTDGAGSIFPYAVAKLVNSPGAAAGVVSPDLTPAVTTDKEVIITYRVRISDPFTATPRQVSNQGTFTSDDFVTIRTDDPSTTTPSDATITPINTPPVAVDDNYTTTPGTAVTLTPLTGDTDVNTTQTLTVTKIGTTNLTPGTAQVIPVTNGAVNVSATGVISFTPSAGFTGLATIPYTISDGAGGTATANEKITVSTPPTATNDDYTTTGTTPVTLTPLTGDTAGTTIKSINGVDLTPGTAQVITIVGQGVVNISVTGEITFTATTGFTGDATFPYVIQDTAGNTATANEKITVSAAPVVSSCPLIPKAVNWTLLGATPTAVASPTGQTFTNVGPTLGIPELNGVNITLKYVFDGTGTNDIRINGFNLAGTATPGQVGAGYYVWDGSLTITLSAPFVLSSNGSSGINGGETNSWGPIALGSIAPVPTAAGLVVTDDSIFNSTGASISMTSPQWKTAAPATTIITIVDAGNGISSQNQVYITNCPPVAVDDTYTTTGTTPVTLAPLTGDSDPDTGSVLSIKSINGITLTPGTAQTITIAGQGVVNISATGVITFTANAGFTGDATFPYVIQDAAGNTATANEKITVSAAPTTLNIKANKTADKTNTFIGDNIIYTLDFENIGTADASGATIKDTLPAAVNVNSISCVATGGAICPLPTPTAAQLSSGVVVNTFPAGSKLTYTVNTTVTGNEAPAFVNWTSTGNNTAAGTLNGVPMTLTRTILTPSCIVAGNTVIYGTQTEAQQLAKSGFSPSYYTPQPTATTNWLDVGVDQNYCPANNGNQTKVTLNFSQPVKDPTIHILNLDAGQMVFDAPFTATKVSGNSYFEVDGNVFNSVTNGATITGCGTGSNGTQAGCGSALAAGYYNSISFFLNDTTPVPGNGDGFQMTISTIPVATTVQNCAEATVASGQIDSDTTNNNKCVSVTIAPPFVNSPPVAVNDSYTTPIGTPKVLTPLTGDTDPDAGQTLTVTKIGTTVLTPGTAQTITFPEGAVTTSTTGVITFTPNPTFTGVATIPYTISDGNGGTAVANEIITIIKAVDDLKTTPAGVPVSYNPLTNDNVPVGSTITKINGVTPVVGTPIPVPGGTVTLNADGTITVTPTPGSTTPIVFPYEVTTPDGTKVTATDTITVIRAIDDVKTIVTGTPTTYDPKANDVNIPTGSTITSINGTPVVIGTPIPVTGGTVTVNADGTITVTPTPGSNAPVTFPYEITTPDGTKVTANDTINQVNAVDDTKTTPAGVPVSYNPLTNDNVPTGSTITKINGVTPVVDTPIPVPGGTVTLNADGTTTVTPTPGSTTPIIFPYEVTTPDGTKVTATDTITVTNQPPVAVDDNYTTTVGVPVVLTPLTADTDPDGNVLTVTKIDTTVITPGTAQTIPVTNGTVTISATGVIVFTPAPGFVGTATIPYTISDGNGGEATANELVTIPQIATLELDKSSQYNDLNGNGSGDVNETITYTFKVKNTGNVPLTNVTISDPTVTISGGPIATLAVGATDTTTFTANHVVTAADISAGFYINTATASGTPPVGPAVSDVSNDPNTPEVNDPTKTLIPPFAFPDLKGTAIDKAVTYNPLSNDILPSGSTLKLINGIAATPGTTIPVTNGSVLINADGTITVTPENGFTGTITFPYVVQTIAGDYNSVDTINVYKAADETKTTPAGTPVTYDPMSNDVVPSSSTITKIGTTPVVVGTPITIPNGTVTVNADGSVTVTPNPGYTGTLTFPYEVTTPDGVKVTANDTVNVVSAVNDTKTTPAGTPVTYDPKTNDNVPTGSTITKIGTTPVVIGTPITITDPITGIVTGTVTVNLDGTITVTPALGSTTPIVFNYEVTTPDGVKVTATDTITVIRAIDEVKTTPAGSPITYNLVTNDVNIPVGSTITSINGTPVVIGTPITVPGGTVTVNVDGTITVTATPGSTTPVVFPYEVTTPDNVKVTATDTINQVQAVDDIKTTLINTPVTYNPLTNDTVPTGSTITQINGTTPVVGTPITVPGGTVTLNPDGTITVTPTPGSNVPVTFSYEVTTPNGVKVTANDTINIIDAKMEVTKVGTFVDTDNNAIASIGDKINYTFAVKNTGNVALTDIIISDDKCSPIIGTLSALTVNATDSSTFTCSYTLVAADITIGKVINSATGTAKDPSGNPVTDISDSTDPTKPSNDDPTVTLLPIKATDDVKTTPAGVSVTYNPLANDVNIPAGSTITMIGTTPVVIGTPITVPGGTVTVNSDGTITVTPTPGSTTPIVFVYEVTTPDGTKVTATDTITPLNAVDDVNTVLVGIPITYNPLANDVNIPAGSTITMIGTTPVVIGTPITVPGGTVMVNADGTITVTPTPGSNLPVTFPYEITSPDGTKVTANDTVNQVNAVDDTFTTPQGTPAIYNPLTNDNVPPGSTITKINGVTPVVGTPIPVTGGTVTLNPDGTVTVTPALGSTIPVTFPYDVTTPDGTKVTANDTVTVQVPSGNTITINPTQSTADLSVIKVGDKVKTANGDSLTYTITATNNGPANVNNAIVQDVLPSGYTVTSITCISTAGSTCPIGITTSQLGSGLIIPALLTNGQITITIVGTVTTIQQLFNKAEIKAPAGIIDPNLENNISSFPTIIDPPSGKKLGTYKGRNIVEWKQVWINELSNISQNATITDDIPAGTEYVPGTLQCSAKGVSTTSLCEFNTNNNSTTWIGRIGGDLGNILEETAANEVVITFQILLPAEMNEVENQSQITTESGGSRKSDNPGTNDKIDITRVSRKDPESIKAEIQASIQEAPTVAIDFAAETIRTGGFGQPSGFTGIIFVVLGVIALIALKRKSEE